MPDDAPFEMFPAVDPVPVNAAKSNGAATAVAKDRDELGDVDAPVDLPALGFTPHRNGGHVGDGEPIEFLDYTETADLVDEVIAHDLTAVRDKFNTLVGEMELLPLDPDTFEDMLVGFVLGHLWISGPSGIGKTMMTLLFIESLDYMYSLYTADPEWTRTETIGGYRMGTSETGPVVLPTPIAADGLIPNDALRCARTMRAHRQDPRRCPAKAHVSVIDEGNRADLSRILSGALTSLGDNHHPLSLQHHNDDRRGRIYLPGPWRMIITANEVDHDSIYHLTSALGRRFGRVRFRVPTQQQLADELLSVRAQAGRRLHREGIPIPEPAAFAMADEIIGALVSTLRGYTSHDVVWEVGTAYLVDTYVNFAIRLALPTGEDRLSTALDSAVAMAMVRRCDLTGDALVALSDTLSNMPRSKEAVGDKLRDIAFPAG